MKDQDKSFRNHFHFTPRKGWMNDPNGLSWFDGAYHLFYQHHPDDVVWGPMHWGHAVSTDLLTWRHLPVALRPDQGYDRDGCFSGSATVLDGRHVLMYTGHRDPDDDGLRREVQCLAWGDGDTYQKDSHNPVIGPQNLPAGVSAADFRDPKLWREGGLWYCLVAHRYQDGNGELLLFSSPDLYCWDLVGPTLQSLGQLGEMWECPDFFSLDGHDLLLWSVMKAPREPGRFQNLHSCVWASGKLNRKTGRFEVLAQGELDQGTDFYAPQTLETPDGRRVLLAWMHMWERTSPARELGLDWAGCLTLPRELRMHHGRLVQAPARELEGWRGPAQFFTAALGPSTTIEGVEGQQLDLEVRLEGTGSRCTLAVFVGDDEETLLVWDAFEGVLTLDRSRSGHTQANQNPTAGDCQRVEALVGPRESLHLRLVLDRSALEVFVEGGQWVLSSTVFPQAESRGIEFRAEGEGWGVTGQAWALSPK